MRREASISSWPHPRSPCQHMSRSQRTHGRLPANSPLQNPQPCSLSIVLLRFYRPPQESTALTPRSILKSITCQAKPDANEHAQRIYLGLQMRFENKMARWVTWEASVSPRLVVTVSQQPATLRLPSGDQAPLHVLSSQLPSLHFGILDSCW